MEEGSVGRGWWRGNSLDRGRERENLSSPLVDCNHGRWMETVG